MAVFDFFDCIGLNPFDVLDFPVFFSETSDPFDDDDDDFFRFPFPFEVSFPDDDLVDEFEPFPDDELVDFV